MKAKLFLLKPDFIDLQITGEEVKYFCSECVFVQGLLSYYPNLETELEVTYSDFQKPRKGIIELLGEDNQNCPSLIIEIDAADTECKLEFKSYKNFMFSNDPKIIAKYFNRQFNIGIEHP